jgi:predicted regulator of Ras-like GTPase activity (Roadblock/LC7/MglB family)
MDAAQALADLTEISPQIEAAVVLDEEGTVLAATVDDERAREVGRLARELLSGAETLRTGQEGRLTQLQAETRTGSVFVLREGGRLIAATTPADPTVGLVFYDLRTALRSLDGPEESNGVA